MAEYIEYTCNGIAGMGLQFEIDGFRIIYGVIVLFAWTMALLFSREYMATHDKKARYYIFTILTLFATVGVFLSADLYTTYIFFEIMSLTSYVWVVQDETRDSMRAGATYLGIAIISGMTMLMGLFMLYDMTGTLRIDSLMSATKPFQGSVRLYIAGILLLVGFGAKAGAFPLHIWLPKAHTVAPAPVSALLSGILTKVGIFGIVVLSIKIFYGNSFWGIIILGIGMITMLLGSILALFSQNIKRILACSSISQIGFILLGIGIQVISGHDNLEAVWGTMLHMINHSSIKLVPFLSVGVIYMNTHRLDINDVRGFGRNKILLKIPFLIGAIGICGIPLGNGYISKTLLHESILLYMDRVNVGKSIGYALSHNNILLIEGIFILSGAITIAYMSKLYIAIFVEHNNDTAIDRVYHSQSNNYMSVLSSCSILLSATPVLILGLAPHRVMEKLAILGQGFMGSSGAIYGHYYSWENIKGSLITIVLGVGIYLFVVRLWMMRDGMYEDKWFDWLDIEELIYRPVILKIVPMVLCIICRVMDRSVDRIILVLRSTLYRDSPIPHEIIEGNQVTHIIGNLLDSIVGIFNRTIWIDRPYKKSIEHKLSLNYTLISENNTIIGRSLSFGLLLVCLGLIMVLGYVFIAMKK